VENCTVWENALNNEGGTQTSWSGGLNIGSVRNAILRDNEVYYNWGEGLSCISTTGSTIEDNVVYDNWAADIYICDSADILLQRNLVYNTGNVVTGDRLSGILLGDENYAPPSHNITIINNLVANTMANFYFWGGDNGGALKNDLIAYNTFLNSANPYSANIYLVKGSNENTRFENNIIEQDDATPIAYLDPSPGLLFSNNLWSNTPPIDFSSPTDIIEDPKLSKAGSISPGLLTYKYFKLLPTSPAINKATILSDVTEDFIRNPRGSNPDIGGIEYGSG
jgi:parallel beta-helix repeat protein